MALRRSKLHVDLYNWTGTNLVLRGEKFVRLIPPGAIQMQEAAIWTSYCPDKRA